MVRRPFKNPPIRTDIKNPGDIYPIVAFPADTGGCGFYRIRFPLSIITALRYASVTLSDYFYRDIRDLAKFNTVAFQRQCSRLNVLQLEKLLEYRSSIKKKILVTYELDDNVHVIHPANQSSKFYGPVERQNIITMMSMVDRVSFSTEPLRQFYYAAGIKNSVVIPNYLPFSMWGGFEQRTSLPPTKKSRKKPRILWTGSSTHHGNKNDTMVLRHLVNETKHKYIWIFQGSIDPEIRSIPGVELELYPWVGIHLYPSYMYNILPDLAVVPLIKSDFNYAKSDLKLLELGACYIPGVFSDIGPMGPYKLAPYKIPHDADVKTWEKYIKDLINNIEKYKEVRRKQIGIVNERWLEDPKNIFKWCKFYGIDLKMGGTNT